MKNDTGYNQTLSQCAIILLDGKKVDSFFTADEELKCVWINKKNENGEFMVFDGDLVVEMLTGDVEILMPIREITKEFCGQLLHGFLGDCRWGK